MIKFEFHDILDEETIEALWDQDVNMDDWDYLLFVPKKFKNQFQDIEEDVGVRGKKEPISYQIAGLLNGRCANAWYPVKNFKGKKGIVGVAYHA